MIKKRPSKSKTSRKQGRKVTSLDAVRRSRVDAVKAREKPHLPTAADLKKADRLIRRMKRYFIEDEGLQPDRQVEQTLNERPLLAFAFLKRILDGFGAAHDDDALDLEMDPEFEALLFLFEAALTEIRFSAERSRAWAVEAAQAVQHRIAEQALRVEVAQTVQACLIQAIYDAGLEVQAEIRERSAEMFSDSDGSDISLGMPDLESLLAEVEQKSDGNPFNSYEPLMSQLDLLPPEGQLLVIATMATSDLPVVNEIAALALMHGNEGVRTQVPEIYQHIPSVSPTTLRRMIGIRNWLPQQERPALDEIIKRMRKSGVACAHMPQARIDAAFATTFDGSGCQGAWLFTHVENQPCQANVLIKQEVGIRDVFVGSELSRQEAQEMREELLGSDLALEIHPGYIGKWLPHFIWEGLHQGQPPKPALLEVAEATGQPYWIPAPLDYDKELARMGETWQQRQSNPRERQRILEQSIQWPRKFKIAEAWFEDDAKVDALLKDLAPDDVDDPNAIMAISHQVLKQILEPKRAVWTARLVWMALWLRACKRKPLPWTHLFVIADELHRGTPLEQVPLMRSIASRSILSAIQRQTWETD